MKNIVIILMIFTFFIGSVSAEKKEVIFSDCVDGDTIKVEIDGVKATVRFLAIDTPETVHPQKDVEAYGKEASDYTCDKVKNAKKLEIEYDQNSDKTDKYERELAWIFVDDILLQKELISLGYAKVAYLYGDYMYTEELQEEEKKAGESKLGIWSLEEYTPVEEDEDNTEEISNSWFDKIINKMVEYFDKMFNKLLNKIKNMLKSEIDRIFD